MAEANTKFVALSLTLDTQPFDKGIDAAEARLQRFDRALTASERRQVRAIEREWGTSDGRVSAAKVREAQSIARELGRIHEDTRRMAERNERERVRAVERMAKAETDARNREARRAANEFLRTMKDMEGGAEKSARLTSGAFTKYLGAAFFADLAVRAVTAFSSRARDFVNEGVKLAANLRQKVANVASIKPEIDTSQVNKALREMQTRIPQTAEQLAEALYDTFSSINATQAEGLALVEKNARGATAAVTDAKTFGTAVIGVMNAYGKTLQDVDHIQDVFFNTVKNGVVTGEQLALNLGVVTQAGKNAGASFDELGALIAGVTKEGGNAAQNINNLANFLMKLPTKEARKGLAELKVEAVDLQTGGFRPILSILSDLKQKLDALPPAVRAAKLQEIFPDAQARTGLQTLLSQLENVKTYLDENVRASGAAAAAYETQAQTYAVAAALQENSTRALQASIGDLIAQNPYYVESIKISTEQLNSYRNAVEDSEGETSKFANSVVRIYAEMKAQFPGFVAFVLNGVRMVADALGLVVGGIVTALAWIIDTVKNRIAAVVNSILNYLGSLHNAVRGLVSSLPVIGQGLAANMPGEWQHKKVIADDDTTLTDTFLQRMRETFADLKALDASQQKLMKEAEAIGKRFGDVEENEKRLREAQRYANENRTSTHVQKVDGSWARVLPRLPDGSLAVTVVDDKVAKAREVAEAARAAKGGGFDASDLDGTAMKRRGHRTAEEFDLNIARAVIDEWRRTTGSRAEAAFGMTPLHRQQKYFHHKNAADVKIDPRTPDGRLLIEMLEAQGVPYRASTGREVRNGKIISTGPHIHVGPSSRFGGGSTLAQQEQLDKALADLLRARVLGTAGFVAQRDGRGFDRSDAWIEANPPATAGNVLTSGLTPMRTRAQEEAAEATDRWRESVAALQARMENFDQELQDTRRNAYLDFLSRGMDLTGELVEVEERLRYLRREAADDQLSEQRRLLAARSEEYDLTQRIVQVQDELANGPYNQSLRVQLALLEDISEMRRRDEHAIVAQNRAQIELADATEIHAEQVRARVLGHLADQTTFTQAVGDTFVSMYDRMLSPLDRALDKLSGKLLGLENILKAIVHQLANRVFQKLLDSVFPAGGQQNGAAARGFSFGNIFSGLGQIFRPSGVGPGGTPVFNPGAAINFAGAAPALTLASGGGFNASFARQMFPDLFGPSITPPASLSEQAAQRAAIGGAANSTASAAAQAASFASLFKGFGFGVKPGSGGALSALAPLLGVQLGASLGGPSGFGQLLGAVGGGLAGIGLTAAPGALAGSFIAPLFSNPFTAIAGAALLIGSFIVGRNAQRRRDEHSRDSAATDARSRMWDLIQGVKADRIEGPDALTQAASVVSEYMQQASALKDSKARRHAELYGRNELGTQLMGMLKQAADEQAARRQNFEKFIPTFSQGGVVGASQLIKVQPGEKFIPPGVQQQLMRFGGTIPGVNRGRDDTYMYAQQGTVIVPAGAGPAPAFSAPAPAASPVFNLTLELDMEQTVGPEMGVRVLHAGLRTDKGQEAVVGAVRVNIRDKREDGVLGDIADRLGGRN